MNEDQAYELRRQKELLLAQEHELKNTLYQVHSELQVLHNEHESKKVR
jgi:hypothetical protein